MRRTSPAQDGAALIPLNGAAGADGARAVIATRVAPKRKRDPQSRLLGLRDRGHDTGDMLAGLARRVA